MSELKPSLQESLSQDELRSVVRQAVEEFVRTEHRQAEPAYKTELQEERKRRESLEARLNQVVEENRKARAAAEESDRYLQIRNELQKAGVSKVELAFRALRDDVARGEDGRLHARTDSGRNLSELVSEFVQQNPELLPARIAGGSGAQEPARVTAIEKSNVTLDSIRPGMSKEELEKVRQHISRLASQALKGA